MTFSRVGNYRFQKTIGKGQFGKVKLATHIPTGHMVAVKIIDKTQLDDDSIKRVQREVTIMKLLGHQNIIRLIELMEADIFLFIVMELADGGEIMDLIIAHGRLNEEVARYFFRQIVKAIDYCHSLHVIHRDIKTENILLDGDFNVKIIDFGLSNKYVPGKNLKTFCGSPTFTAPELIKKQEYEGTCIDIWSMGVVLYVLVSGVLPFDGTSFRELFDKIINAEYEMPEYLSDDCKDLISKIFVVDPDERIKMDEIMEHAWLQDTLIPTQVPDFIMEVSETTLDPEIMQELSEMGYDINETKTKILANSYSDAAATYFLLLAKKREIQNIEDHPLINILESSDDLSLNGRKLKRRKTLTSGDLKKSNQDENAEEFQKPKRKPMIPLSKRVMSDYSLGKISTKPAKNLKKTPEGPRHRRIPTNEQSTFDETADVIETTLHEVLHQKEITFEPISKYRVRCFINEKDIFEIEICSLKNLGLNGIKFDRISGDVWQYKDYCKELLECLHLSLEN